MARLLTDECVALQASTSLQKMGHDVISIDVIRGKKTADDGVLWLAANDSRTLITHNTKDFVMLHRAWHRWGMPKPHPGILILNAEVAFRGVEISRRVDEFFAEGHIATNTLYKWGFGGELRWILFDVQQSISDTLDIADATSQP